MYIMYTISNQEFKGFFNKQSDILLAYNALNTFGYSILRRMRVGVGRLYRHTIFVEKKDVAGGPVSLRPG
jgi:hypothetical protein